MATACATVNLGVLPAKPEVGSRVMRMLVTFENWLDRRASSRALYRMDDRALADIGLSRADVERLNITAS